MSQAIQSKPAVDDRLTGENLTIDQTLRVMDIAREIRDKRETAEEMFRRDDLRRRLREKLLRTAELSGDTVSETEIDVAIDHYLSKLHTYEDPPGGMQRFLAHCWVKRGRLMLGAAVTSIVAAGAVWMAFF